MPSAAGVSPQSLVNFQSAYLSWGQRELWRLRGKLAMETNEAAKVAGVARLDRIRLLTLVLQ